MPQRTTTRETGPPGRASRSDADARPGSSARSGATARSCAGTPAAHDPLRRLLLALLGVGTLGLAAELVLLDHTESRSQLVPFVALGLGLAATLLVALRPGRRTIRVFRVVMTGFVGAGLAGLYLHYRGNVEFELEMYPELAGFELFREALTGATPALAPGALAQLGLLGLAFTYRHPALRHAAATPDVSEEVST